MNVFLGGTCNHSTWRDQIMPMLAADCFNPVVADWTPASMAEELRQRETCDICLYVITPKMTGVYSIAEVIDDSNKRPNKTVLVRLRMDENDRFTDGQWRSLDAVAQMVKRNGGVAFDSLESATHYINAIRV
ncbi:MAG: nucleoside 2-deoxyribosyltransferase domain-containing protein [Gallionella sp.]|nr:nucleoside 2-deoxyribosyltransferase domain-containing protein [Gallionella sp.]MDD4958107.1 nucleoside 2-deoxyribosyltransferase domain-containing protein [Gallionella sp.]